MKKRFITGLASFSGRKLFGYLMIGSAFAALVVAELLTQNITHSNTYYQEHYLPRFMGACLAFIFSYALLFTFVLIVKLSKDNAPAVRSLTDPDITNNTSLGALIYVPYVIFLGCALLGYAGGK